MVNAWIFMFDIFDSYSLDCQVKLPQKSTSFTYTYTDINEIILVH